MTGYLKEIIVLLIQLLMFYLYPVIIAVLFVPSVFIYYNESALIYSVWYLVVSSIGLTMGIIFHKLTHIRKT